MNDHTRPAGRRHPASPARRGIATLEFVLSMPFLLLAAAMAFGFGAASVAGSDTAIKARHDAWNARAGVQSAAPFDPATMPDADRVRREATERFPISGALAFVDRNARAEHSVLAAPWDHSDAPFQEPDAPFIPHLAHLEQLMTGAARGAPALLTDPAGLADFAQIGEPGTSSLVSSALSGFTGSFAGVPSSGSGGQSFPVDKLSQVPNAGNSASDVQNHSSKLGNLASQAHSGSLGGVTALSKGAAEAQQAILMAGATIFAGVDDALDPLDTLTGALDGSIGGGSGKSGGVLGGIVGFAKDAIAKIVGEVAGLLGGEKAKENVKKLVDTMKQLDELRHSSPFGKLARAAWDSDSDGEDEL
jgi:hypothetical protein